MPKNNNRLNSYHRLLYSKNGDSNLAGAYRRRRSLAGTRLRFTFPGTFIGRVTDVGELLCCACSLDNPILRRFTGGEGSSAMRGIHVKLASRPIQPVRSRNQERGLIHTNQSALWFDFIIP